MKDGISLLERYSDTYRDIVIARVWAKDESPKSCLGLNSENDWSFICVAMDILGDANLALSNFADYSLDGPTKYDDTGEKYLRLYGLLSAAYNQQQAALKLYQLMSCDSPSQLKRSFDSLRLREMRHKLASHGLDYEDRETDIPSAYVPIRIDLSGFRCSITKNRGDTSETVCLDDALIEHLEVMHDVMDKILDKSIRTFFKGQQNNIAKFEEELNEIRDVRDGKLIVNRIQGEKILIRVVEPTKDHTRSDER